MVEIPIIETDRLRLTAFGERHFEAYASMLADPGSTKFVGDGEPLDRMNAWRSMAMLLGHWQLRGYGMWAIELKDSGKFIGRVGLHRPEGWPDLELGWMLTAEQRGHGYATEGARAALDFAFKEVHPQRVDQPDPHRQRGIRARRAAPRRPPGDDDRLPRRLDARLRLSSARLGLLSGRE